MRLESSGRIRGIDSLPLELVIAIFKQTTYLDSAYPLLLLLVCRSWANLVEQAPSLWTQVSVDETKPDFFDRAFTHVYCSKDAQMDVTISGGRRNLLPVLESLFTNKWAQIRSFTWIDYSTQYEDELCATLARLTGLYSLSLGRMRCPIINTLASFRNLRNLEGFVRGSVDVNQLMKAACQLPKLDLLNVKVRRNIGERIDLDPLLFQELRLRSLTFKPSIRTIAPFALSNASIRSILSNNYVRHVDLQLHDLDQLQLPKDFRCGSIETLRLATTWFIGRSPELIRSLSHTLTSLCLAFSASHEEVVRVLKELPKLVKLKEFEWAGSCTDQRHEYSPDPSLSPLLPRLSQLAFWATCRSQVLNVLTMRAPQLEHLRIESSAPVLAKIQKDLTVRDALRAFLQRSSQISKALLWGLPLCDIEEDYPSIEMPLLTQLEVYANSPYSLSLFRPGDRPIELSITIGEDPPLEKRPVPSGAITRTFFESAEALTFHISDRFNHFQPFAISIHLFSHLRVLSICGFAQHIKHVDKILEILHHDQGCPVLEELRIAKYPNWDALLGFISSRNSPTSNRIHSGAAPFRAVGLPRQPHPTIHYAIQRALAGGTQVALESWIIPPDMLSHLCLGCKSARIHTCQWSDDEDAELSEYCLRHPPRANVIITHDMPRL